MRWGCWIDDNRFFECGLLGGGLRGLLFRSRVRAKWSECEKEG
jgi:hypothetical protein